MKTLNQPPLGAAAARAPPAVAVPMVAVARNAAVGVPVHASRDGDRDETERAPLPLTNALTHGLIT